MTEHSKIPLPEGSDENTPQGNSLIERAAGRFRLESLRPPPVPRHLPPARAKRGLASGVERKIEAPAAAQAPVSPRPAEQAVPTAEPVASAAPRVDFSGQRHPIDRARLAEQGLIVPEGNVTALLEEFRIVKRQLLSQVAALRREGAGAAAQRMLICSPHSDEGKTYCSVNLAMSMAAEKEGEVLLVDADFAKPALLDVLGLPEGPGLMDALINESTDVADFVLGTDIPGLWVLPAGNTTNSDSEYLASSRTAHVLDRLTQGAPQRMVIFDSPPALAASPAAELAKHVAHAVMIVRADKTGKGAIEDALSLIGACPNIQLLLNAVNFSPSGRRFGSYYRDGR